MKKRHRHKNNNITIKQVDERYSVLFWLVMAFVALFLFIAPFKQGLFNGGTVNFEGPIYHAMLWTFIALMIVSIYFFFHWKLQDHRDILSIAIWLIPLSYVLSLFNAVSYHSALNSVYIHTMYAVFFLIGLYFARNELGSRIIQYSILLSGYMLVIFGWMNWFGDASLFGLIQYSDGVGGVSNVYKDAVLNLRMSNVFQYPNTYAAYLNGLLIISLLYAIQSKKRSATLFHASMFVPIMLSFLLTNSRGALLMFPIVVLLTLLFIPWKKQLMLLLHLFVTSIVSLFLMERTESWIVLIAVSFSTGVILAFIQIYLMRELNERYANEISHKNIIIPGLFTLLGIISFFIVQSGKIPFSNYLPTQIVSRIQSINMKSAFSRNTFYGDSFEIIKDYFLFGAGGGAWSRLYPQYQSYPYTSNQVHNFFLQYTIEAGIIGLLILLALLIYIGWLFIKRLKIQKYTDEHYRSLFFFAFPSAFLIHSVLDFDMTYVYVGALVFLCLGGMVSNVEFPITRIKLVDIRWNKIYPIVTSIISIIVISAAVQSINAHSFFSVAQAETVTQDYNRITEPLDRALEIKPYHPTYALMKINLLNQLYQQTDEEYFYQEAISWIDKLSKGEPYSRQLIEEEYSLYLFNNDLENAANVISNALNYFPWDTSLYERIIKHYFDLGMQAYEHGDFERSKKYWNIVIETYENAIQKKEQTEANYELYRTRWRFNKTSNIALILAKIHFIEGNYEKASSILEDKIPKDLSSKKSRIILRWYLAALQMQGINEHEILETFLEMFPKEKQRIQEIIDNYT